MTKYEITFLTADEKSPAIQKVKTEIESLGGKVLETTSMNRRALAYPIKKHSQAFFTVISFEFKNDLKDLEAPLRLEPEILRFLIVKNARITKMELDDKGKQGETKGDKGEEMPNIKYQISKSEPEIKVEDLKKKVVEEFKKEKQEEKLTEKPVEKTAEKLVGKKEEAPKVKIKPQKEIADEAERLKKLDEELEKLLQE